MKLMDIDSEQLGIPDTDYDAKIRMPSGEFAKIMRDLKDLGESVRIEATSEGVKFTAEGEIGTGSVTIKPTGDWEDSEEKPKKKKAASKTKVKKEGGSSKVKKEKNGDDSDEEMEEDEEDVKPKIKDEPTSDDEEEEEDDEDSDDDEEGSDSEDDEPKKKKKVTSAKKGKKSADGEDDRRVFINVTQAVSLNFSIKYLNNFAKSTPLSSQVMLQMSNDVPLLVRNLSVLSFELIGNQELTFGVILGRLRVGRRFYQVLPCTEE